MAGVEITDEKSLEAWLKTRPRRDALIIHGRSAIRNHMPTTFGLIVGGDEKNNRLLSYLRFLQVTGLMRTYPHKALEHAFAYATKDFQTLRPTQLANIDLAKILTFDDYDQEIQAIDEINPVRLAEVVAKQEQWLEDAQYLNLVLSARDCDALANGHIIAPIWHDAIPPDWFTKADAETRAIWAKDPETWDFWVRWWDGVIAGKPLPIDLQREVALIDDEIWQQGPKAVAEAIRAIEAARSPQPSQELTPDQVLDRAVAKLPPAKETAIAAVRQAVIAHRADLLENFAALQGFIALEITRLQTINYMSDEHRDLCIQQAKTLSVIALSVERLGALVPQ